MIGIGALIRVVSKANKGIRQMENLETAIGELGKQCRVPVLDNFPGVARFDAAISLLDATLIRRLTDAHRPAQRWPMIRQYLAKNYEEYQMAKEQLKVVPAMRSEVVALGLALKEVSLTLDREVEDFRRQGADVKKEIHAALESALAKLSKRIDERLASAALEQKTLILAADARQEAFFARTRRSLLIQRIFIVATTLIFIITMFLALHR